MAAFCRHVMYAAAIVCNEAHVWLVLYRHVRSEVEFTALAEVHAMFVQFVHAAHPVGFP
jgi:hypothetical protein